MTDITAEIICDSIARYVPRLPTFKLRYPRFIHAELMTHRVFSRNARSSRAVPIATMIRECMENPVIPLHWGAAQAGMQAMAETRAPVWYVDGVTGERWNISREESWLAARDSAVQHAQALAESGYAKQLVNRLLEPFLHIDVLVTTTELENWFALRDHADAEPHIRMLAQAMRGALDASTPRDLSAHGWHLPYIRRADEEATHEHLLRGGVVWDGDLVDALRRVSAARCARISYRAYDGSAGSIAADLELADKLAKSGHWSPFEHQATPDSLSWPNGPGKSEWANTRDHGNFVGWRQNRRIEELFMREAA